MTDIPDNVDLQWIARHLVDLRDEVDNMRVEIRALFTEINALRIDVRALEADVGLIARIVLRTTERAP